MQVHRDGNIDDLPDARLGQAALLQSGQKIVPLCGGFQGVAEIVEDRFARTVGVEPLAGTA